MTNTASDPAAARQFVMSAAGIYLARDVLLDLLQLPEPLLCEILTRYDNSEMCQLAGTLERTLQYRLTAE